MHRRKAASSKDVAARAGVSQTTVSLVLNNRPGVRIAAATRQRITDAARELGYQSNSVARALVTGRTDTIGFVLHHLLPPTQDRTPAYAAGILEGAWGELAGRGFRLLLADGSSTSCAAGLFRERTVDGLLILAPPAGADDPELRELVDSGFPVVCVGSPVEVCGDRVCRTDIDNLSAGRQAADMLIRAGHRELVHLAGALDTSDIARARLAGVRAAMTAAGLRPQDLRVIDGGWNLRLAEERIGAALDHGLRWSGIIAANANMAEGAIRAMRTRGLEVPADVSISCIDWPPGDTAPCLPLSRLEQPYREIGRQAARQLAERIANPSLPADTRLLPLLEVAGATIA